jgi:hypothetical protein
MPEPPKDNGDHVAHKEYSAKQKSQCFLGIDALGAGQSHMA